MLPTIDLADRVREAGFALLITTHEPVDAGDIASSLGLDRETVDDALARLVDAGWIDQDATGQLTGAAGLSLTTGPHRLELSGAPFRTWCAYDALGIAAALSSDARLQTRCGQCGSAIDVWMDSGWPIGEHPERLWRAQGGEDLRHDFCEPTVLLCCEEHAQTWAEAHDGHGNVLTLEEAAATGAADWADCAGAASRINRGR